MRGLSAWILITVFSLVAVKGLGQDLSLLDALDDDLAVTPTPQTKPKDPAGGPGEGKDFDLSDLVNDEKASQKPPVLPKDPVKPKPKPEETRSDLFAATVRPGLLPRTTALMKPLRPSAPPRKTQDDPSDFDLSDALEPNDIGGKGKDTGKGGGIFSDDDLLDVGKDDSYKPDKGKGERGSSGGDLGPADDNDYDTMAETGTIAGIVSAVAMALVGAVSSYISYQKKKLCFSIQQSLNADVVKADNPEAVVAQEPQVQQTLLQPPNAEPPTEDNAV